jgi:transcriptional antiterminator NusG
MEEKLENQNEMPEEIKSPENIESADAPETTPLTDVGEPVNEAEKSGEDEPAVNQPEGEAETPAEAETEVVTENLGETGEPGSETVPAEIVEPKPVIGDKKWYVIQALTGQEDKVKIAIEQTIEAKALHNKVFQVLLPIEETVEIKGGKRIEKVKKMFPGYVFLEMILDEESWYLMRETPGVARFIGTKVKPTPVSDKEMQRVLKQLGKEEKLEISFEKGDGVRVISGPFRGYTGTVDEVNAEKGKLKVLINIFGRDTPVEVNVEHAQKLV